MGKQVVDSGGTVYNLIAEHGDYYWVEPVNHWSGGTVHTDYANRYEEYTPPPAKGETWVGRRWQAPVTIDEVTERFVVYNLGPETGYCVSTLDIFQKNYERKEG